MKKYLLVLLFSFACAYSWAQIRPVLTDTAKRVHPGNHDGIKGFYEHKDSVKKFYAKDIRFANANQFDLDTIAFSRLDSTLTGYQNYSPYFRNNSYYMNNGNLGLANRNLFPQFGNSVGFNNGQTAFSLYEVKPENVQYYRVYAPFTELNWVSGFGQESLFYFIHTQNIKPNFNLGFKYYTVGSKGSYPNQQPKDSYLTGWAWYQSKNLKYNLVSNITVFNFKNQENGGLPNDSIFTAPSVVQHQYEDVFLHNATNTWKDFSWFLKQTYVIGKRDTNAHYQNKLFKSPYSRVSYEFLYNPKSYNYKQIYDSNNDPLSPTKYYQYNYYDSLQTHDEIKQHLLRNDIDLALFGRGNLNKFNIGAGLRYDYLTYKQSITYHDSSNYIPINRSFNNLILKGRIGFALSNTVGLTANGEFNLAGYNFSDYLLYAIASIDLGKTVGNIQLKALSQNAEPEYLVVNYSSNHHKWSNDFSKINTNELGFYFQNDRTKTSFSGEYFLVTGYTYLKKDATDFFPIQASSAVHLFRVKLDQEVLFGRFGWSSHFTYQKNNSSFIATPAFYTYQSIYYQNKIFNALAFQVGVDGRYYTGYKSYGYAPEIGKYYIDNSTRNAGNYPIIDLFLTANLRRTRFLVKYDYLNQGWGKKGYYTVDKYPMPDRQFKFGISWRFYD